MRRSRARLDAIPTGGIIETAARHRRSRVPMPSLCCCGSLVRALPRLHARFCLLVEPRLELLGRHAVELVDDLRSRLKQAAAFHKAARLSRLPFAARSAGSDLCRRSSAGRVRRREKPPSRVQRRSARLPSLSPSASNSAFVRCAGLSATRFRSPRATAYHFYIFYFKDAGQSGPQKVANWPW